MLYGIGHWGLGFRVPGLGFRDYKGLGLRASNEARGTVGCVLGCLRLKARPCVEEEKQLLQASRV